MGSFLNVNNFQIRRNIEKYSIRIASLEIVMKRTFKQSAFFLLSNMCMFGILAYAWFKYDNYPAIDTAHNFKMLGIFLGFGLIAGGIVLARLLKEGNITSGNYIATSALRYYFAFTLITIVFPKIYSEIYQVSYHTFDKKIIDLKPVEFIRSFYTYNPKYEMFMGWVQLLGALLLCFRKTYILGAAVLLPILTLNIMHSYFFDIQNFSMSGLFFSACVLILLSRGSRLFSVLFNNGSLEKLQYPFFDPPTKLYKVINLAKVIGLVGFTTMVSSEYIAHKTTWWNIQSPIVQGVWKIDKIESESDDIPRFERFFFERGRRGIVTSKNDTVSGFQYIIDTSYHQFEFWNFHNHRNLDFKGKYELVGSDTLIYKGRNNKDSLMMQLSRIKKYDRE